MSTIITILQSLIGSPAGHVEQVTLQIEGANGSVSTAVDAVWVPDLQYITASILLIIFYIGFFRLLLNFQKSFQRGAKHE